MTAGPRWKPLISVSEAADLAGVSRSVAYQWARTGCLPGHVELNGRSYVKRAVLVAWLAGDPGAAYAPPPDELPDAQERTSASPRAVRPAAAPGREAGR